MSFRSMVKEWLDATIEDVDYILLSEQFDLDVEEAYELANAICSMRVTFELDGAYED